MKKTLQNAGRTALAATVAAFALGSAGLFAQEETPRERELMDVIKRLESRVTDLEKTRELEKDSAAFETQINSLSANMSIPDSASLAASWKEGFGLASDDKNFSFKIHGRVQNDWTWAGQDDDLEDTGIGHLEDGFRFRRARLGVTGVIHKYYEFKMEFDFAQGDADFTDVYMGLINLGDFVKGIRVGQFKEPMSLEELTSSRFSTFIERALPTALVPSRNNGMMVYGNAFEDRMSWAVGGFRDTDAFGDSAAATTTAGPNSAARQEDGKYAVSMRLTGLPVYEDQGDFLIHLGASFRYANPGNDEFNISARPESRILPNFVATGDFPVDDFITFGFEMAVVWHSFSLQGEFIASDFSGQDSGDAEPFIYGYYVEASYWLTGEKKNYKTSSGTFDRVKPAAMFLNEEGGAGAWQLALRYSELDLNDDGVQGGELSDITFGVNWHMNPNMRWMFNFTYANVDDRADGEGEAYIFAVRWQFDF